MLVTLLGTGTSHGIPVAGCGCRVCLSNQKENKRDRCSLWIREGETSLVIDTPPEFRLQAVREKIGKVDAVFVTHAHADHLHGLDDLRPYCRKKKIPIYAKSDVRREIEERFPYIFAPPAQGGGTPRISMKEILPEENINLGALKIVPIPVFHGNLPILGFRIGDMAYITDGSRIPDTSLSLLENLDTLIINGLRYTPHETHFSIPEAVEIIKKISPGRAYLTHICHDVDHFELKADLPGGIEPAWDGLTLTIPSS